MLPRHFRTGNITVEFHLNREGRNQGIFPLEDLRRRRASGELMGTEYVWREGMTNWQFLDEMLAQNPPAGGVAPPPPLPLPAARAQRPVNRGTNWGVVAAVSLFFCLVVAGVIVGLTHRSAFLPVFNPTISRGSSQNSETAMEAASKPVTWTKNTLTATDMQKLHREFRVRQWVEGYQKRGDHGQACDADATAFLNTWLTRTYGGREDTYSQSLADWADKLAADASCTDPLVLTIVGVNSGELHERVRRLQRAVDGFPSSKHLAYPKFYALVSLADSIRQLSQQDRRIVPVEAQALEQLRLAFVDGSLQPEDQAECADILVNGWGYNYFYEYDTQVRDLVRQAGKKFEWLSLVLDGEYHVSEAWKARGGGYVNTVTEQGWQGFNTHLAEAEKSLTRAWKLRPDLAVAPERMIYVSLGQGSIGDMRTWFDRAIAAQIDEPRAWSDFRWGLRPRWYGDLDSMRSFGITAVTTARFDTDVPRKFFDVISDMESEQDLAPGKHIYGREDIWPTLQTMYEGYIAEPTQSDSRDGWRSTYATVAYLAGKYDASRKQLEALNWKPWPDNLTAWGADLSLMANEVAARTGPSADKVADAENARNGKLYSLALRLYTEIEENANTDERTREFARCRCAGLRLEQQLEKGGWVDFLPQTNDDPNWVYSWDETHQVTNGALEFKSDARGHLCYSRVRVGSDFEVQGEFEVAGSTTKSFQGGLVMGMPDCNSSFNSFNWYGFRMRDTPDDGPVAVFSQGWSVRQVVKPVVVNKGRNTFRFRLQDGRCTASVNDVQVFNNVDAPVAIRVPDRQFLLGVGAFNNNNETVIRYRNVQVRKLQ